MPRRLLIFCVALAAVVALSASAATPRSSAGPGATVVVTNVSSVVPTLFTIHGTGQSLASGAQKALPVTVSEDRALDAVFHGGMWLPNASGGREYAKYARHILHDDGNWTWVGKVQTTHGEQSVVITFGKDAVFGHIPQASGHPLRLVTARGQKLLVQTDGAKMARLPIVAALRTRQDYQAVPRHVSGKSQPRSSAQLSNSAPAQASDGARASPVIDVLVAYTPGLVSDYGTVSAALTRIDNLIDMTNQAYVDSGVNQRVRLVHTMQVNYTDTNDDSVALDDITGSDGQGNNTPVPAALQGVASARTQYGADLVVLLRHFNSAGNKGCGDGWLIGSKEQPIVPSEDNAFGYSVVQDGSDAGYFCLNSTFAHELGHNMASAHDRANADEPGEYPYSYGYIGNGSNGFATIMAYGSAAQTPLDVFSNPNISKCQGTPCGVADSSPNSADNAHSLNNTAALIAQFEPTKVVSTSYVHNDLNGDGKSDLFWYNAVTGFMTYWLMDGPSRLTYQKFVVPKGYLPITTGDFDGNGHADILWKTPSDDLEMWLSDGTSFVARYVLPYPDGWVFAGTGDMNGDGNSDLFWYNPDTGQVTCWLMSGATRIQYESYFTNPWLQKLAVGDFDGNGHADILWRTPSGAMYMWLSNGVSFSHYYIGLFPVGWVLAGTGDENSDGRTDLFWYNGLTGKVTYWLMNGHVRQSYVAFLTNPGLTPLGSGDFDGDGHADLLWETSGGLMYMWLFNGVSYKYYNIGPYPLGWTSIR